MPICNYGLHVTCSCITIHCTYLSFFPEHFLYYVFFFFYFSFSFLTLAPKKSIPSKNPITRRGSSSSLPFLSARDRFRDSKSQKDFEENFSDKAIHLECQVILSNFLDTPLPSVFSTWGWESLYEKPLRCPNVCIQEFYSNIHAINTFVPRFTMVFRGKRILVTQSSFTTCP